MNILIIEDEALVAMEMEMILAEGGHCVAGLADTPDDAMVIARNGVDLALVDVHLARGTSGLDAARSLGDQEVPCLFVTSACPPHADHLALGCLLKPYSDAQLLSAISVCAQIIRGETPTNTPSEMILFKV